MIYGYSENMKTVIIIRDRGQLTIPDSIRRVVPWANPMSAVSISVEKPDEIIIKPHQPQKVEVNWDKLWAQIKRTRSFKGKSQGNLSTFIVKDRETRR